MHRHLPTLFCTSTVSLDNHFCYQCWIIIIRCSASRYGYWWSCFSTDLGPSYFPSVQLVLVFFFLLCHCVRLFTVFCLGLPLLLLRSNSFLLFVMFSIPTLLIVHPMNDDCHFLLDWITWTSNFMNLFFFVSRFCDRKDPQAWSKDGNQDASNLKEFFFGCNKIDLL